MNQMNFENPENFDLFADNGVSDAKFTRKGRPDEPIKNLDYAEVRHYSLSVDEMALKLRRTASNVIEKANAILDPENTYDEDREEKEAFKAINLLNRFWKPTK